MNFLPLPNERVWFKIAQFGLAPSAPNLRGPWLQGSMLAGANATGVPVTIPRNLRPGAYLIRHEVVNLQSAREYGAQFYVECAQLSIEGDEKLMPGKEFLASFPGSYAASGEYCLGKVPRGRWCC